MAVPTRAGLDAAISERLASDPAFREALIADPRAAVSELLGVELPDAVTITVHEESLTDVHLVIPAHNAEGQISEDELELVAGGACWTNSCTPGP